MFSKKYEMDNTRKFKRLHADYLVKFQPVTGSDEAAISNLKDISAGGVRFWTDKWIPEASLLRLSIFVPPIQTTLEVLGRVLRVRRALRADVYYLAVGFIEISRDQQHLLNEFIEELSKTREGSMLVKHASRVKREASERSQSASL